MPKLVKAARETKPEPILVEPAVAAEMLGYRRSKFYELMAAGLFDDAIVYPPHSRERRIHVERLREIVSRFPTQADIKTRAREII